MITDLDESVPLDNALLNGGPLELRTIKQELVDTFGDWPENVSYVDLLNSIAKSITELDQVPFAYTLRGTQSDPMTGVSSITSADFSLIYPGDPTGVIYFLRYNMSTRVISSMSFNMANGTWTQPVGSLPALPGAGILYGGIESHRLQGRFTVAAESFGLKHYSHSSGVLSDFPLTLTSPPVGFTKPDIARFPHTSWELSCVTIDTGPATNIMLHRWPFGNPVSGPAVSSEVLVDLGDWDYTAISYMGQVEGTSGASARQRYVVGYGGDTSLRVRICEIGLVGTAPLDIPSFTWTSLAFVLNGDQGDVSVEALNSNCFMATGTDRNFRTYQYDEDTQSLSLIGPDLVSLGYSLASKPCFAAINSTLIAYTDSNLQRVRMYDISWGSKRLITPSP